MRSSYEPHEAGKLAAQTGTQMSEIAPRCPKADILILIFFVCVTTVPSQAHTERQMYEFFLSTFICQYIFEFEFSN